MLWNWVWRMALALAGLRAAFNSSGCLAVALWVREGAHSDTDWWFWLMLGLGGGLIALALMTPLLISLRDRARSGRAGKCEPPQ